MASRAVSRILKVSLMCLGLVIGQAQAQEAAQGQVRSPVLVIDAEQIYRDSAFGRRIAAEVEAKSLILGAENREIEAELTQEERRLTDLRPTLEPEAFRKLADEFDEKVRLVRREQDTKARNLSRRQDDSRGAFLTAAGPVLEAMMLEAGAAVVLERRSVFLSLNAVDITRAAVQRLDAEIGDGLQLEQTPTPQGADSGEPTLEQDR
ncbi:MAG: OmpH family outer membrane protein [Aliishimia sp.]